MKIGCCMPFSNSEKIKKAKDLGYDFVECSLSSFSTSEQDKIDEFVELIINIDLPCKSVNGMFPSDIRLTGKNADFSKAEDYLYKTLEKTKDVGFENIIFGSSGARQIPEDFSKEAAIEQLIEFCSHTLVPIAEKYNKVIGIEELQHKECNIINTCKEAMYIIRKINKPQIRLLVDLFHIGIEQEPIQTLVGYKNYISHVHIASPKNNREFPKNGDGEDYKIFFDFLRLAKYKSELISIEGNDRSNFIQSSMDALECLKNL